MPDETYQLLDGSTPFTPQQVELRLQSLNIDFQTVSHEPMFTVEQSRTIRSDSVGGFSKNLFLRNKKGSMWLVTLEEDRVVDLKELGRFIGAGRVSFASKERLMQYLGVLAGAVTPLAAINDLSCAVTVVLDAKLLAKNPLHFHPCANTMTTSLSREGLLCYLNACDHEPVVLDFDAQSDPRN